MKPIRNLLVLGSLALLCCLAPSCVDQSYDLDKADYKIQVLKDGLNLPIGNLELRMDSILKVDANDTTGIRVRNNMYYFSSKTTLDVSGLNSSISNFNLTKPGDIQQGISIPTEGHGVGYSMPLGSTSYSSSISTTLPAFSTALIDVKRVNLVNTTFTMRGATTDLGGSNLNNSITIKCTPQDNVAEYYVNGVHVTGSWTINANENKTIEIRSLDVSSSQALNIACEATINVVNVGDVTFTGENPGINVSIHFDNIDFESVYGKITYSMSDSNTDAFEGFGDLLSANQNVLSLYNPTIKFNWRENLGVPVHVALGIDALNENTNQSASLTGSSFTMAAAASPSAVVVDSVTFDRSNGTSDLLKINPTKITTSYSIQTDGTSSNSFITKDVQLALSSTFEVPVQFGSDLMLNVTDTIDNPLSSVLENLSDQDGLSFGITFDVKNRIPLSIKIKLIAENADGDSLFAAESGIIEAAGGINAQGFATTETSTATDLTFTSTQVDQLKDVTKFRVAFVVSASQDNSSFVTISPDDYIKMSVGAVVSGGVILDLNKKEDQ